MHALIERLWCEHRFTALLVTHDVQEAVALGERIVLIEEGRISFDAPIGSRTAALACVGGVRGAGGARVAASAEDRAGR